MIRETERFYLCDRCGAFETLDFKGHNLDTTAVKDGVKAQGKWYQVNGEVIHDCKGEVCLNKKR